MKTAMIDSTQNEKIKHLVRLLNKNNERKSEKVFVVEGKQENNRAILFHFEPVEFFICETYYKGNFPKSKINFVSEKVYEKIAYRSSSEGIVGLYKEKEESIETFQPQENSSIIIVEGIEKPGNLGAILRSCEAFGIDALIITDTRVDLYNPNVIRSSVGCLFGMNVFQSTNEEIFDFLKRNNFNIITTFMSKDATDIAEIDFRENAALLFGTEHSGLSNFWKDKGVNTMIKMSGTIDSINLSNAVAIGCYEISRQKNS